MTLHEKTLELNITHELLNLADPRFTLPRWQWYILPYVIRPMAMRHCFYRGSAYATGLHTNMEGKDVVQGGSSGVDVAIRSNAIGYCVYIQFKVATRVYKVPQRWNALIRDIRQVVKYELRHKQHSMLTEYARSQPGVVGDNVVYALPEALTIEDVQAGIGQLAFGTTFMSAVEINRLANINNVNLNDGKRHWIYKHRGVSAYTEVHSEPFDASTADCTRELIADIAEVRLRSHYRMIADVIKVEKSMDDVRLIAFEDLRASLLETLLTFGTIMSSRIAIELVPRRVAERWEYAVIEHNENYREYKIEMEAVQRRLAERYAEIVRLDVVDVSKLPEPAFEVLKQLPVSSSGKNLPAESSGKTPTRRNGPIQFVFWC